MEDPGAVSGMSGFTAAMCQMTEWEQFSPAEQDRRIEETYSNAIRPAGPA
ncbi:hypothetical protein [Caballeronia mineralivorans]|nr:hypothetical protein [Caballeronia mineralivorans]